MLIPFFSKTTGLQNTIKAYATRRTARGPWLTILVVLLVFSMPIYGQEKAGSIRGIVIDQDFEAALPGARVEIIETGEVISTSDQGSYIFRRVAAGKYTLVISKPGYVRQVRANVVVSKGELTDVNVELAGDFTEMEEFIVEDLLRIGSGSEAALLQLRLGSPSFLDSISSDLMSKAGASDAASALRLVSGTSVQDGKFAVIRGLPDRYVSSQLNGVRLPSADEKTRAVQLDQFPSAVIESIQVSKTFTPDQQGDASGGAVNVKLKSIPEKSVLQFKTQLGLNSEVNGRSDFLSYDGGGVGSFGFDGGGRDVQTQNLGGDWAGAAGVSREDAPIDYKLSAAVGGKRDLENGWTIGGLLSVFYERDSAYIEDGRNDSLWVENPGDRLSPESKQGSVSSGDFLTSLFDVQQGTQAVQWGGLATIGAESDDHSLGLTYLYSHTAEDQAVLAEDTRGKEFFFPGYDPADPNHPGNDPGNLSAAPYLRTETLAYTERNADTLQLTGEHSLGAEAFDGGLLSGAEVDWTLSLSSADLDQPDKRQFGSAWIPAHTIPGIPPFIPDIFNPATHLPFKPAANFNLGNFQRIYKTIEEESRQASLNVKLPFDQWEGEEAYVKLGLFSDRVDREFDEDTFSNFGDSSTFQGEYAGFWSAQFPTELGQHPITASTFDVDYDGTQEVRAVYGMLDLPLSPKLSFIGGARLESTETAVTILPEEDATWLPPGALAPVQLNAGDADVDYSQTDLLPAIGFIYEATDEVTLRAAYSQTLARQTFRELTPVIQQEFLGGPIFIGNPDLQTSALENFDLRVDYRPHEGSLFSLSLFKKNIDDPIEFVQRIGPGFTFTTPRNYPKGSLSGFEVEMRQRLDDYWAPLEGLAVGANATFINSEVNLPQDEIDALAQPNIQAPSRKRDATNAPERLLNLFATYEIGDTSMGLFYTLRGDTLVAGGTGASGNFVPSVYEAEFGTLNFSISHKFDQNFAIKFQAKNLTDPNIKEVYRSDYIPGGDVTKTSFSRGREFSIGITFTL